MAEAKTKKFSYTNSCIKTFPGMNVPVFLQTAGGDIERDRSARRRSGVASLFVTCQWEGQSVWLDRR